MQESQVQFLGQEDPLEKEMATDSSVLAWRIPWKSWTQLSGFHFYIIIFYIYNFHIDKAQTVKKSACNARELSSISGSGRSLAAGNVNPLQYSCLENSTDRGAWQSTVRGVKNN